MKKGGTSTTKVDPVCSPNPGIAEGINERRLHHISLCPDCNLHAAGAHLLRKSLRKREKENSVATAVQEMSRLMTRVRSS